MESIIQDCPGFPINGANYSVILFHVDGVLTAVSRKYGIGVRIQFFRVEGTEADSCKRKYAVSKISGFVWTPHTPPLLCFDWLGIFDTKNDTLFISSPTRTLNIATDSCLFQGKQLRNPCPHWSA